MGRTLFGDQQPDHRGLEPLQVIFRYVGEYVVESVPVQQPDLQQSADVSGEIGLGPVLIVAVTRSFLEQEHDYHREDGLLHGVFFATLVAGIAHLGLDRRADMGEIVFDDLEHADACFR